MEFTSKYLYILFGLVLLISLTGFLFWQKSTKQQAVPMPPPNPPIRPSPTLISSPYVSPETLSSPVFNSGTEENCIKQNSNYSLSFSEALNIAKNSQCIEQGAFLDNHFCNDYTGTWWIDLKADKPGCNPACVIDVQTKTAEINWRCTGLTP